MKDHSMNQQILDLWHELRTMVDALEHDVNKNARGVVVAGVRMRKGLRLMKKKMTELSKCSLEADKKDK